MVVMGLTWIGEQGFKVPGQRDERRGTPGVESSEIAAGFYKTIGIHQKALCSQSAWAGSLYWNFLALCYWTQAQVGGFSACWFVTM